MAYAKLELADANFSKEIRESAAEEPKLRVEIELVQQCTGEMAALQ